MRTAAEIAAEAAPEQQQNELRPEEEEEEEEDPAVAAAAAAVAGGLGGGGGIRVYTEIAENLDKLWKTHRAKPTENDLRLATHLNRQATYLAKFDAGNPGLEYGILEQWALSCVSRGELPARMPILGNDALVWGPEAVILLASLHTPIPHTAQVFLSLLQQGFTHAQLPSPDKDKECAEPISFSKWARDLLDECRKPKPGGGLYALMGADKQLETYTQLIELLSYISTPVAEAEETIKCLQFDLTPRDNKFVHTSFGGSGHVTARAAAWQAVSNLMNYPPQEGEAPRVGEEALRSETIQDPVSGLWVNRGDAFLKYCELSLPQSSKEVETGRAAARVHPLDFSALGFPQLSPATIDVSPVATVAVALGALAAVLGARYYLLKLSKQQ